jgi:hypothetical protein
MESRAREPAAPAHEEGPRELAGVFVVLLVCLAGLLTAAWVFALIALLRWLISAIF